MAVEYIRRLIISGPEVDQTLELLPGTYTVGRQAGNEVRLNHPMISRRHSQVICTPEVCQVIDLGSANGTSLNGSPLPANTPYTLDHGAVIEAGPFKMLFEQIAVEPVEPPPPKPKPRPKPAPKPAPKPKPEPEPEPKPPPPPPKPPAPPPQPEPDGKKPDYSEPPPGLSTSDSSYLQHLPGIYQNDFMARFLAIFEAVLAPIEWNVDNFDLYLDPDTAPEDFMPWLANWFSITFDPTWSEEKQRILLNEAHELFGRRGTRWALSRILEIYLEQAPEILDQQDGSEPFTFTVKLPVSEQEVDRRLIEAIVDANKPAHTNYELLFKKGGRSGK